MYEEWLYLHVANSSIPSLKYEYITVCHIFHWNTILLLCNANKVTEQRNLGNLAHKIKCKWENQENNAEMSFEREQERDFTQGFYVTIGKLNIGQIPMV